MGSLVRIPSMAVKIISDAVEMHELEFCMRGVHCSNPASGNKISELGNVFSMCEVCGSHGACLKRFDVEFMGSNLLVSWEYFLYVYNYIYYIICYSNLPIYLLLYIHFMKPSIRKFLHISRYLLHEI